MTSEQCGGAIGIGVAGLGRAFMLMLPALMRHPRVRLAAAADPRPEARARFESDFGCRAYGDVGAMCADPAVDAVYVASPHGLHVDHVRLAAAHGRHILVEKPMALTVADCRAMVDAVQAAGVQLLVGHSHSFDLPYLRCRALIESGAYGAVRMITALNFTDYLYRPRRPEELDTTQGGGAVHNQAPHQVDIIRLLAGGRARSVRAVTGAWDPARPTEGAYAALMTFDDGVVASFSYSGHGHYDTDEVFGWTGEMGQARDSDDYGAARRRLENIQSPQDEAALKASRAYGLELGAADVDLQPVRAYNHFGTVIVSCERGDLRPTPGGVMVYGDGGRQFEELPCSDIPRREVIDEWVAAIIDRRAPLHNGIWGTATTEICGAILASSREGREIQLAHQVGIDDIVGQDRHGR